MKDRSPAWRFLPLMLFLGLMLVLIQGLNTNPKDLPSALLNQPFPHSDITLPQHIHLINVWGSWCPACQQEHPLLMTLSKDWSIVGLNYKDEPHKAQQWLQQWGNPYQSLIADPNGQLGLDLGVYGAPETYLMDHQRTIRLRHAGILTQKVWETRFLPAIAELTP